MNILILRSFQTAGLFLGLCGLILYFGFLSRASPVLATHRRIRLLYLAYLLVCSGYRGMRFIYWKQFASIDSFLISLSIAITIVYFSSIIILGGLLIELSRIFVPNPAARKLIAAYFGVKLIFYSVDWFYPHFFGRIEIPFTLIQLISGLLLCAESVVSLGLGIALIPRFPQFAGFRPQTPQLRLPFLGTLFIVVISNSINLFYGVMILTIIFLFPDSNFIQIVYLINLGIGLLPPFLVLAGQFCIVSGLSRSLPSELQEAPKFESTSPQDPPLSRLE